MSTTILVILYFAIGALLFFGFWRWVSSDKPGETDETFFAIALLVAWPLCAVSFVLAAVYYATVRFAALIQR